VSGPRPVFSRRRDRFRLWAPKEERVTLIVDVAIPSLDLKRRLSRTFVIPSCRRSLHVCALASEQRSRSRLSFQMDYVRRVERGRRSRRLSLARGFCRPADPGQAANGRHRALRNFMSALFRLRAPSLGAAHKLRPPRDVGVTAVDIQAVMDFKGRWNWCYDGHSPTLLRCGYGRPEDVPRPLSGCPCSRLTVLLDFVSNPSFPRGISFCSRRLISSLPAQGTAWAMRSSLTDPTRCPVRELLHRERRFG